MPNREMASDQPAVKPPLPLWPKGKGLAWILALVVILVSAGALFLRGRPVPQSEAVAVVNGQPILKSTYDALYDAQRYYYENVYPSRFGEPPPTMLAILPRVVLDSFIEEAILEKFLKTKDIAVTDDEVHAKISETVVNDDFGGDWAAYENDLQVSYATTLANVMHNFRVGIMIEKAIAAEGIDPQEYPVWYATKRDQADVQIFLDEYHVKELEE